MCTMIGAISRIQASVIHRSVSLMSDPSFAMRLCNFGRASSWLRFARARICLTAFLWHSTSLDASENSVGGTTSRQYACASSLMPASKRFSRSCSGSSDSAPIRCPCLASICFRRISKRRKLPPMRATYWWNSTRLIWRSPSVSTALRSFSTSSSSFGKPRYSSMVRISASDKVSFPGFLKRLNAAASVVVSRSTSCSKRSRMSLAFSSSPSQTAVSHSCTMA
mmetsp:Transcript_28769/g.67669  ORF Transcript_28769/g.67669 Transcript_28769/m.67669 type:complete len:223 (+) Transcript_28769:1307-1975(+)